MDPDRSGMSRSPDTMKLNHFLEAVIARAGSISPFVHHQNSVAVGNAAPQRTLAMPRACDLNGRCLSAAFRRIAEKFALCCSHCQIWSQASSLCV